MRKSDEDSLYDRANTFAGACLLFAAKLAHLIGISRKGFVLSAGKAYQLVEMKKEEERDKKSAMRPNKKKKTDATRRKKAKRKRRKTVVIDVSASVQ